MTMITDIEDYFTDGCGRCERFATPDCSTRRLTLESLEAARPRKEDRLRSHYDFRNGRSNPYVRRDARPPATPSRCLEIHYRRGRAIAAYLYLARRPDHSEGCVTRQVHGLPVDFDASGGAIGVEIQSPFHITLEALNRTLAELGQPFVDAEEFAPLAGGGS